jgi:hypothetical protein
VKIESLYKHFLLTKASHLPVVGIDGNLIGFIAKERVLRELADLGEERPEYDHIPEEILQKDLHENLLNFFKDTNKIPVLDHLGERKEFWDKPRVLAEFSKLDSVHKKDPKLEAIIGKNEKRKDSKDSIHWYMELILANFPDGLLSTDVAGNAMFYNEAFESKFLPLPFFKDSVEVAERFLRDLNRDLFAKYLQENDLEIESNEHSVHQLQSIVKEVDAFIRIITLRESKKVVGFLYQLAPLSTKFETVTKSGTLFPDLDEALRAKYPLERVLEEMESRYIYETLKRNRNNISHAASDLSIPRTTLQNRIKFLKISERFKEEETDKKKVIPRKRAEVESTKTNNTRQKKKPVSQKKPLPKKQSPKKALKSVQKPKKKSVLDQKKQKTKTKAKKRR